MKLLYNIFVVNDSDPGNPDYVAPFVRLSYIGGATGTPMGRIYKTGDPAPAFTSLAVALTVATIAGETYEVEYADDDIPLKHLSTVQINGWVGGCFADSNTINWLNIYRFSSKVQVSWFGSTALAASIDGGSTYKNMVFSGISYNAEWTDTELDLLGYTDIIPSIQTRRTSLTNVETVSSFADPFNGMWPPSSFTRVNIPDTTGYTVGTSVNFSGTANYGSGFIVEVGAGYFIMQHSFNGNPGGVITVGYQIDCVTTILNNFFIGELSFVPFILTELHTDVTVEGGSDGTITLNIAGGSGSFTFVWDDGPLLSNRDNLIAGSYHVVVTDTVTLQEEELTIIISEPNAAPVEGTFLDVPFMNSLQWVDKTIEADDLENPQALDNRLFCEQEYEGFEQTNYFNKVCKIDSRILQFYSDFSNFRIDMFDYHTDAKIKEFAYQLKEQNIGMPQDFAISIKTHTVAGQSRVYFSTGPIPIPLNVGEVFTIFNNIDGFNGNYSIVTIEMDLSLGYQYLVINKNYAIVPASSAAVGRFFTSAVNFNVFESVFTFLTDVEGEYYFILTAIKLDGTDSIFYWVSEPIELRTVHKKTNLIEYRNRDNAFGITWTTGYIGQLRVESHLFKRLPGGERSTNRNSNYSLTKINAKKIRGILFETYFLPPYLHEKLSTVFDCDAWSINKVFFQTTDAYAEPKYIDDFMLADSNVKIEQQNWFPDYNSDDLGTVNEIPPPTSEGGIYDITYDSSYE